jgi:hypothetical protein
MGLGSGIRDPGSELRIRDPDVKKAPDPGSESATLDMYSRISLFPYALFLFLVHAAPEFFPLIQKLCSDLRRIFCFPPRSTLDFISNKFCIYCTVEITFVSFPIFLKSFLALVSNFSPLHHTLPHFLACI